MGAGAVKPGTPAVGGKGAAQPSRPTLAPAQGASMPAQGGKAQPTNTLPAPGQTSTVPPQGKGAPSNVPGYAQPYIGALPPQVPPQGGKSQAQIDQINADMAAKRTGQPLVPAQGGKTPGGVKFDPTFMDAFPPQVQQPAPGQLPPQGGKSSGQGGNPEQLAYLQSVLDASRLPPTTTTPSNLPGYAPSIGQDLAMAQVQQPLGLAGRPEIQAAYAPQTITSADQLRAAYANQPAPQVQKPAPIPGLGLAALRNKPMPILKGRR